MSARRRLKVCYVVPGHALIGSAGPTRNVLNLAEALSAWAEVTVAFRRGLDPELRNGVRVVEIEPGSLGGAHATDDSAVRGVGYAEFVGYLRRLRRFAGEQLLAYDVVLEKSWLLSGYLSAFCRRRGVLGVPIENIVPHPGQVARRNLAKFARLQVGSWLAGRYLRGAPLIIAETEFLKADIQVHWRVAPERIAVVDLGVDRRLFHPRDQAEARRDLSVAQDKTILLYVGVLDDIHNLAPLIEAMARRPDPSLELHVVGDGHFKCAYEGKARDGANIVFHGRVAHDRVPLFIAAADLCCAPYDPAIFAAGRLGYSTMKIPEYLSCGRPVASVASGRIPDLIKDGVSGFLLENDLSGWLRFLDPPPSRARLRKMAQTAANVPLTTWEDTARSYLALCERALATSAGMAA